MRNQTWIFGSWILLAGISLSVGQEIRGLGASGPTPEFAQKMMLFGQCVGDWECDVVLIQPEGSKVNGSCEWHFGWVLQGRAIQDVFVAHYPDAGSDERSSTYGTTVRWYDSKANVWQIRWINARQNVTHTFTARQIGNEIVLDGTDTPHPHRWDFSKSLLSLFIGDRKIHWTEAKPGRSGRKCRFAEFKRWTNSATRKMISKRFESWSKSGWSARKTVPRWNAFWRTISLTL